MIAESQSSTGEPSTLSFWGWLRELWSGPSEHHFTIPSTPENSLNQAKRAELQMSRLVSAELSGDYASAFLGQGLSFSELRDYQPGDDPRNIHWNVTARFGKPFVKVFREERQLRVVLLLDVSASMVLTKRFEDALAFSSLLLSLSEKNRDQVGFATFSDDLHNFAQPKSGRAHYRNILFQLMNSKRADKTSLRYETNFSKAFKALSEKLPKNTNLFILSDFEDSIQGSEFSVLAKQHDVTCVYFPGVAEEPLSQGLIRVVAPETGTSKLLNSSSKRDHRRKMKQEEIRKKEWIRDVQRAGADPIVYSGTPLKTLHMITKSRRKRRR